VIIVNLLFIAEAFNLKIETVVKWFILIIVIVFDPFAVCLLIAYNILIFKKNETLISLPESKTIEKIVEKVLEKPVNVIKEIYHEYKRGTKRSHNPDLADPNIED
jgi:hypothetical protein